MSKTRAGAEPRRRELVHVSALDGLRGVAVLMVVWHHVVTVLVPGSPQLAASGPIDGGFLGVDVFFVLSGFLITSLLVGERERWGRVRLGSFYARRALRLLPALYVLLGAHLVYVWVADLPARPSLVAARDGLFYVSNWTWRWEGLGSAADLGHLWSLAIEEQFYLVWPLAVIVLLRVGGRRLLGVVTLLGIAAVAVHRARLLGAGEPTFLLYMRTDTRIDSMLVGALAGQLWTAGRTPVRGVRWAGSAAIGVIGVAAVVVSSQDEVLYRGGFTLLAILVALVLLATVSGGWWGSAVLALRPLRSIGRVSYGLYLWHLPVFVAVGRAGTTWGWPGRTVTGLALAAAATAVSWTCIESPALRLKRRWEVPRPAPDPVPIPAG